MLMWCGVVWCEMVWYVVLLGSVDIMELMYRTAYWSKSHLQVGSVYLAASGSGYTADCPVTDFGKPYSDEVICCAFVAG